jgi:anti-anti-sigma factor
MHSWLPKGGGTMRFEREARSGEDSGKEVIVYSIEGELYKGTVSQDLVKAVREDLKAGHKYFVFNLANLSYTNSSGIELLIGIKKSISDEDGACYLSEMNTSIASVFLGLSLFNIFPYAEKVEIAVGLLTSESSKKDDVVDSLKTQTSASTRA